MKCRTCGKEIPLENFMGYCDDCEREEYREFLQRQAKFVTSEEERKSLEDEMLLEGMSEKRSCRG